jgi:hypothetical protein
MKAMLRRRQLPEVNVLFHHPLMLEMHIMWLFVCGTTKNPVVSAKLPSVNTMLYGQQLTCSGCFVTYRLLRLPNILHMRQVGIQRYQSPLSR